MKAKKVYENIDFERGKDPKASMGVGRVRKLKKIDNWVNPPDRRAYYTTIEDGNYGGFIVVIYKSIDADPTHYAAVKMSPSGRIGEGNYKESSELAWEEAKKEIDHEKFLRDTGYYEAGGIHENIEFERGKNPKQALGIGMEEVVVKGLFDLLEDPNVVDVRLDNEAPFIDGWGLEVKYTRDSGGRVTGRRAAEWYHNLVEKHLGRFVFSEYRSSFRIILL